MARDRAGTTRETDTNLTIELARLALVRAAPEEMILFEETAAEFFEDPRAALNVDVDDEPLGAGIDVAMMTPYLLSAAGVVLPVLGAFAGEVAKDITKDLVKEPLVGRVRAFFRQGPGKESDARASITPEQAAHIRQVVVEHCRTLALPSEQAALIADATVGSLEVSR